MLKQPELDGRVEKLFQGRVLGGSSMINGSAYVAPSKAVIDAWAKLDNPSWTYDALLPYYKKSYSIESPDVDLCKDMGVDLVDDTDAPVSPGPIQLSFPGLIQKKSIAKAWNDHLAGLGYRTKADLFPTQSTGNRCYTAAIDPQTKKRASANPKYAGMMSKRPNLSIVTEATVLRILFSNSPSKDAVAEGVEVRINDHISSIKANKEVIVSAGVFNSAKILELSGVGDPHLLKSLGITPVAGNPNVGEHVQNHIMCIRTFELEKDAEIGEGIQSLAFLPLHDKIQDQSSKASSAATTTATRFHDCVRDILNGRGEASCCVFMTSSLPGYASLGLMQSTPFSHGSSHITSAKPDDSPSIDPKFFTDPLDLEILARHLVDLEEFPSSKSLSPFFKKGGQRLPPNTFGTDVESAKEYLRKNAVTTHHACGTAAMLPQDQGGVVNQNLIVYGTTNVRVVDASVFPVIPQANPMSTVYAVAERAADLMKGKSL